MALQMMFLQKMMFSHMRLRVPFHSNSMRALRSYVPPHYSILKRRLDAQICFKRMMVIGPIKIASLTQSRFLYQISEHSYSTLSSDNDVEHDVTAASKRMKSDSDDAAIQEIFETKTNLSNDEWEAFNHQIQNSRLIKKLATRNDIIIMRMCETFANYALANSYVKYLQTQNCEPNPIALSHYLLLCAYKIDECGEDKVLDVYTHLCSKLKIFDVKLSEMAILALTKTREWKQAFKHIPVIKALANISPKVYSALIAALFKNGEYDSGWQLLDTMYNEEKKPRNEVFMEWIKQCELSEEKEAMTNILFHKFALNEIYPSVTVAKEIMKIFEESIGWSGTYVKILDSGICPACHRKLETTEVDEEAFARLKEEFVVRVLHRKDIYKTTSPEEWSRFCTFVKEEGPFDIVVDGLNVAYSGVRNQTNQLRMRRLSEAVAKIKKSKPNVRIMVIGRMHMSGWSPRDMSEIRRIAKVFTLDNLSKDDAFFIYAALQSGSGVHFVSSDLLRDHIHQLGDVSLRKTFRHWQRKNQVYAPPGWYFVPPPDFTIEAQKQGTDAWHIPYNDGTSQDLYLMPDTWLCLQSQPHRHEELVSVNRVSRIPFECSKEEIKDIEYWEYINGKDSRAKSNIFLNVMRARSKLKEDSEKNYKQR